MLSMIIVGGLLAVIAIVGLVGAEMADRRRAIRVGADAGRFTAAAEPTLPWLR